MSFYTNISNLSDGFGEYLKFVLYSIFYAEYSGGIFHYTPFQPTMEHNYEQDPDFLKKKEDLVRFDLLFPLVQKERVEYQPLGKFNLLHFFEVESLWVESFSRNYKKCKQVFFENRTRPREQQYAVVHIRRMNQLDKSRQSEMIEGCDVPDYIYEEIIREIYNRFPGIEVHVFSQGKPEDFRISHPVLWRLNESIETSFQEMAFADLLVVAPSAFSYCAALYSRSDEIWYIQSLFKPLSHWKPIQGYVSTRNKYEFFIRTPEGKVDLVFDPKENRFWTSEGKEFLF